MTTIIVPKKRGLYAPDRIWGQRKFQRGIIVASGVGYLGLPTVSPRADGDTNLLLDVGTVTCWQGCDFDIDGDEWENTNTGGQTNQTVWLDSGSASQVWVEFVRTSGTQTNWDSHTSAVRYQISTNRRYSMSVTVSSGSATKDITGFFRMWSSASGGTALWTGSTVLWRCTATVQTGPCSLC